jgi:hypothetical protein
MVFWATLYTFLIWALRGHWHCLDIRIARLSTESFPIMPADIFVSQSIINGKFAMLNWSLILWAPPPPPTVTLLLIEHPLIAETETLYPSLCCCCHQISYTSLTDVGAIWSRCSFRWNDIDLSSVWMLKFCVNI